jgi:hypothetical protein
MGKNILLDTNILKNLVSRTEFSPYLKQIMVWHERGDIVIYYPDTLKFEWVKHREEELKKISDVIRKHQHIIKVSELFNSPPDIGEPQLAIADKRLQAQVNEIDKLLENAIQISDESLAAGRMWEQKKNHRAPFRSKTNSFNDAVILFSTLEELVKIGENELYFFSENHTDFAAAGNEELIHPDISNLYSSIKIIYYSNMVSGIKELVELGLPSSKKKFNNGKFEAPQFFTEDLSKNIEERLRAYFSKRFLDINFLPKQLYSFHSPIIIGSEYDDRRTPFSLNTDNEDVFDLFENFAKKTEMISVDLNEQHFESKFGMKDLCEFLRKNLINEIIFADKKIKLPIEKVTSCDCEVCNFRSSKFYKSYEMLSEIDSDSATLKTAYILYLHGNWKDAISVLINLCEVAEKESKWLTYYISKYNLLLLGRLLRYRETKDSISESLVIELREINMDEVLMVCRQNSLNNILDYLHYGRFMDETNNRMREFIAKIKEFQTDQIQGWSNDMASLLEVFYEAILFMEQNYLMIDSFSDITSLTGIFLEGLFASYVCHNALYGKLAHLTDDIIVKVVAYGNSEDIIKYRDRYGIKQFKYERNINGSSLVLQVGNLCNSYAFLSSWSEQKKYDGMFNVWIKYRTTFDNALTIASILDMSAIEIELICNYILKLLRVQNHLHEHEYTKSLSYFINNKAGLMTDKIVEEFLNVTFMTKGNEFDRILQTICKVSKKRKIRLQFTDNQWKSFKSEYFVESESQNDEKIEELLNLYRFTSKKGKKEIRNFLLKKLGNKFQCNTYYLMVLNGYIKPIEAMTKTYEQQIIQLAKKGRDARIYDRGFYSDYRLDQFINLSFYLARPLSLELKKAFGTLDNYYKWITGMNDFEYENFNTDWLFNHLTIYYKDEFRNSKSLQLALRPLVMTSKDSALGQLFIDLYSPL